MSTNVTNKIIYPELSYILNGIFFKIHNQLGRFCKEKHYQIAFEKELIRLGIPYKREFLSKQMFNGQSLGNDRCDFLIDDKIIVEIKAKKFITKEDYYQLLRYLKAHNIKLGLLVNFRNVYIKAKRIAN